MQYGCSTCQVLLCRTVVNSRESCFYLWHTKRDIEAEQKKVYKYHYKRKKEAEPSTTTKRKTRSSNDGELLPGTSDVTRKRHINDERVSERCKKRVKVTMITNSDDDLSSSESTTSNDDDTNDEEPKQSVSSPEEPVEQGAGGASQANPSAAE